MKTFLSKIFAITAVIVLLTTTATTPAYALGGSLPGQDDFWNWVGDMTGTSPNSTPAPAATPQPTPEAAPEPTDPPMESSAATPEQAAEEAAPPETAAATTAAPAPEATQSAGNVYIDNSTYNDNRIIYYMPEGEAEPEATPESSAPHGEISEDYEASDTHKRSFLGDEFEVDENGDLTVKSWVVILTACALVVYALYGARGLFTTKTEDQSED